MVDAQASAYESATHNFLLPSLVEDHGVAPGQTGRWHIQGGKAFRQIAESLSFQEPKDGTAISVSSIPNMWARALAFEMALHDKESKLCRILQPQWEGMLAAIALSQWRSFGLRAERVELDEIASRRQNLGGGARSFARALIELAPTSQRNVVYQIPGAETAWSDIYVFYWNSGGVEHAVGASSPSTLVWAAEDGCWEGLPWWSPQGGLQSPYSNDSYLETAEKEQLWHWLDKLATATNAQNASEAEERAAGRLLEGLRTFQGKLFPGQQPGAIFNEGRTQLLGEAARECGPLAVLNYPIGIPKRESSVRLLGSRNKKGVKPAVILDPGLPEKWGVKPKARNSLCLFDTLSYAGLTNELTEKEIRELQVRWGNSVRLLTPDDLLLDRFCYIVQEEAFPGGLLPAGADLLENGEGYRITPFLPFKPVLLDYLTPQEILENTTISNTGSGSLRMTLTLQLSGTGSGPREYVIERDYAIEEENGKEDLPVLEVWPKFEREGWREYYAFYSDGAFDDTTFRVDFAALGDALEAQHRYEDGGATYQIARLQEFPTHLWCRDTQDRDMGLLLLAPPVKVPKTNPTEWRVGVDFGTSFTTVYYKSANSVPEILEVKPLSRQITGSRDSLRLSDLTDFFVYEEEDLMQFPLSSVLTTRGSLDAEGIRPLLDGRIFVPPKPSGGGFDASPEWIHTNLKWDAKDKRRDTFLRHLALEIVAHAASCNAGSIQWAISYPSAYSQDSIQNSYNKIWRNLTEELARSTGVAQKCPTPRDNAYYRTESLAAAQYFADKEDKDLKNAACIDVGGGTSDISIWQGDELVHQCSVKLAGRDLFPRILAAHSGWFFEHYGMRAEGEKIARLFQRDDRGRLYATIDVLLREASSTWLGDKPDNEEIFQEFMQPIAIGFAGLYYYVGSILNVLSREFEEHGVGYKGKRLTPVYMGGNGSRLLHWLEEGGEFDKYSRWNLLFGHLMEKAAGFGDLRDFETELSRSPKGEVACGLVVDINNSKLRGISEARAEGDALVAGEIYGIGDDKRREPLARMKWSDEDLDSARMPEPEEFEILPMFLYEFHVALKEQRPTRALKPLGKALYAESPRAAENPQLWRDVSRRMERYWSQMGKEASKAQLEPPFIIGLRSLVDVLAQRWADKWKRLDS